MFVETFDSDFCECVFPESSCKMYFLGKLRLKKILKPPKQHNYADYNLNGAVLILLDLIRKIVSTEFYVCC